MPLPQPSSSKSGAPNVGSSHASSSSTGPPAGSFATTQAEQQVYDLSQYDSDEDDHDIADENLEAAAYFMVLLLSKNNVEYAIVGGFGLKIRGSTRKTVDVDFGVNLTGRSLWGVLTQAPQRLIIPNSKLISGVVRVFIKTGPTYGDNISHDQNVGVDLLLPEFGGWRSSISTAREQVEANIRGNSINLWVLTPSAALRGKLSSLESREAPNDFFDILFLIETHQEQVAEAADSLNEHQRRLFINNDHFAVLNDEQQRHITRILKLA